LKSTILAAIGTLMLAGCAGDGGGVDLNGAGATFPYPLYSRWFSDYARETGVRINYQSIGSGGGIRQFSENTVDFGATDSPMTDEELSRARGGDVMHLPTVLGAVAVAYNLGEIGGTLRLSGDVISDIFLGRITRWDDARIAEHNPGLTLPARDILAVHRSDGSGTTFVFTDYLAAVSPRWVEGPGRGKEVHWPIGLGGKGNEGVAELVRTTEGAIGYIEVVYAKQARIPVAEVLNAAGEYVAPTPETTSAAAAGAVDQLGPDSDYRVSIVNSPGTGAYPISSFTWLLVSRVQADSAKGTALTNFLRWYLDEGQTQAAEMEYGPLPEQLRNQLRVRIDSIRIGEG
jgi:phosphate transport system substrate-binding protein